MECSEGAYALSEWIKRMGEDGKSFDRIKMVEKGAEAPFRLRT